MKSMHSHSGFMLVTVLIITSIGLLFGVGALLLFKFQCQLRIDRQHELEKVYAVRSALNYVLKNDKIVDGGLPLRYYTGSDRDLGLLIKPVDRIFPSKNCHLNIATNDSILNFRLDGGESQYNRDLDYEYGALNWNEGEGEQKLLQEIANSDGSEYGLSFSGSTETNQPIWWVNIGMRDIGGWLEADYGLRYFFKVQTYFAGTDSEYKKDAIRLCLIRNTTNEFEAAGRRHGWPLSENECALVFEVRPDQDALSVEKESLTTIRLSEYVCLGGMTNIYPLICWTGKMPTLVCYMGMQLAGDRATVFYITKGAGADSPFDHAYNFYSEAVQIKKSLNYFAEGCEKDGDGRIVMAPDLRAVFEVEGLSDKRPDEVSSGRDFLTDFRVTPAYQYDIFIEHPSNVTNLATVAQKVLVEKGARASQDRNAVRTYDTHGTEHKGFRRDERLARQKGGE